MKIMNTGGDGGRRKKKEKRLGGVALQDHTHMHAKRVYLAASTGLAE